MALFAHKQSWRFISSGIICYVQILLQCEVFECWLNWNCFNLLPLAPCAVLFVTLALRTRRLALVAITLASCWILIDLIISLSAGHEALRFGCIQHRMSSCTSSTFLYISDSDIRAIILAAEATLVALYADLIFISVGGPAWWAQTQTLSVCVSINKLFVFILSNFQFIFAVEQFSWSLQELRPHWLWRGSQDVCVCLSWLQVWHLMKILQGTIWPAFGTVALIHHER